MPDKFPEAFERFEDTKTETIDKYKDSWQSMVGEFEEWQNYGATKNQRSALKTELRDYGVGMPKNLEAFERRTTAISNAENRIDWLRYQAGRLGLSPISRMMYRAQITKVSRIRGALKGWQTRGMRPL